MPYMFTLKNSELWQLESFYTQVSQIVILNSYWNMNINRLWYWERTKDLSYSGVLTSEEDGLAFDGARPWMFVFLTLTLSLLGTVFVNPNLFNAISENIQFSF